MLALLAGSMPLGTVATCDYSGGGGSLFYNGGGRHDNVVFVGDYPRHGSVDVFVEDEVFYDDYYVYEDPYYYDPYYYDPYYDDPYYCDPYYWDCW